MDKQRLIVTYMYKGEERAHGMVVENCPNNKLIISEVLELFNKVNFLVVNKLSRKETHCKIVTRIKIVDKDEVIYKMGI